METIQLGKSELQFSRMALGTWAFAGGTLWGKQDEQDAIDLVHAALDAGVNVVDTAEVYGAGASEEMLGRALLGKRHQAVLCTKVYTNRLHYHDLIENCEKSLARLQTDYIDLYQIHWPAPDMPIEEALQAFDKLKRDGKIREIGICNAGPKCLDLLKGSDMCTNQMCYSLLWRVIEQNGTMEKAAEMGMKTWAYSPLAQGLLTGKYKTIDDVPMGRRANRLYDYKWDPTTRHDEPGHEERVFALLAQLGAISQETGASISALAMAFLKAQPHVASVLVGARNVAQLEQNVQAFNTQVSPEVVAKVETLSRPLRDAIGTNGDIYVSTNGGRIF